jgi:XRE family transcriptional regulator, aerobic/anaerobic benzoate catabolism transcriptional regulator
VHYWNHGAQYVPQTIRFPTVNRATSRRAEAPKRTPAATADGFLSELGNRTRRLRARRGLTRKELAREAQVSERHLANLEMGLGNPSVQILRQVARALDCSAAELIDLGDQAPDMLLIRDLLRGRSDEELSKAREALTDHFGLTGSAESRNSRIALVGLRGAGKSTLGRMLAESLKYPFIEVNREVERAAGCRPEEVHSLYGAHAYRRYERRALQEVIARNPRAVIATPGGLVSETTTFNILLQSCFTVWLKAAPEEHMSRVLAQGDIRPMAGNKEAMEDLRLILAERSPFYAKADVTCDTSGQSPRQSFEMLRAAMPRGTIKGVQRG